MIASAELSPAPSSLTADEVRRVVRAAGARVLACCGYGHRGRVRDTAPPAAAFRAITRSGALPFSTQSASVAGQSTVSGPGPSTAMQHTWHQGNNGEVVAHPIVALPDLLRNTDAARAPSAAASRPSVPHDQLAAFRLEGVEIRIGRVHERRSEPRVLPGTSASRDGRDRLRASWHWCRRTR